MTLVDGFVVADHISAHITASGFPIPAKRYSALVGRMVSLPEFLCSCVAGIPSPEEIVGRINDLRDELRSGDETDVDADPFQARVSHALPFAIKHMVDGPGTSITLRISLHPGTRWSSCPASDVKTAQNS